MEYHTHYEIALSLVQIIEYQSQFTYSLNLQSFT